MRMRLNFTSRHFETTPPIQHQSFLMDSKWQANGGLGEHMDVEAPPPLPYTGGNSTTVTANFNLPVPVYVAVPVGTTLIGSIAIGLFCCWKRKLVNRRKKIMEKLNQRRRRSSLKPGSSERGKRFGLTRVAGPDGDPLIIPTAKVLALAAKLDDVEQLVLDYKSFDMGDRLPEKQEYKVKEEIYSISINPMFNSLQSGARGYVLSGDDAGTTAQPNGANKKPGSSPKGSSNSDDGQDNKPSSLDVPNLSPVKKPFTLTSPARPSRLSVGTKAKDEGDQRPTLVKKLMKEAAAVDSSGNSSDESSSEQPLATSRDSVRKYSDGGGEIPSSDMDLEKESAQKITFTQSPSPEASKSPRLSKPFTFGAAAAASPGASLSSRGSKVVASDEGSSGSRVSSSSSKNVISLEDSPRTSVSSSKTVVSEDSPRAILSPRDSKTKVSDMETSSSSGSSMTVVSMEDSPQPDSNSPSLKTAVSMEGSPQSSSSTSFSKTPVQVKHSGKDQSSKGTASPGGSSRSSPKGSASPRFSKITTSDTDQGSARKPSTWNPSTLPERSSIKKAPGASPRTSKSQGASPNQPSSPRGSSYTTGSRPSLIDPSDLEKIKFPHKDTLASGSSRKQSMEKADMIKGSSVASIDKGKGKPP